VCVWVCLCDFRVLFVWICCACINSVFDVCDMRVCVGCPGASMRAYILSIFVHAYMIRVCVCVYACACACDFVSATICVCVFSGVNILWCCVRIFVRVLCLCIILGCV